MRFLKIFIVFCLLSFCFFNIGYCADSDIGDGIPIDDSIGNYDCLKKSANISYIKRKAKNYASRSRRNIDSYDKNYNNGASMGSVIVQPGAHVNNIYNYFEGDRNVVVNQGK